MITFFAVLLPVPLIVNLYFRADDEACVGWSAAISMLLLQVSLACCKTSLNRVRSQLQTKFLIVTRHKIPDRQQR